MNISLSVCAGIVLFHPDMERLRQNIDAVLPQVDKLVLVNNAPDDAQQLADLATIDKIVWIGNDENLGIAAALNQLVGYAYENGFEWLLTLDQDSICCDNLVEKLLEASRKYDNAAMISPGIIENGVVWEDRTYKKWKQNDSNGSQPDIDEIPFCITSGTLTNIEAVRSVGGFDERLFIDEVDRDMCIRLRLGGYRLIRVNTVQINHEFGSELVNRRIFFKIYQYRNYPPIRVYYQMRNMVYMIRKYGAEYKSYPAWRLIRPFFTFFIKFIFEPQRLKRLSAFVRGYTAGLKMRL